MTRRRQMGRPPGQLTTRRKRALRVMAEAIERGERITHAEIARRCGFYDYRDARRVRRDIERYGLLKVPTHS